MYETEKISFTVIAVPLWITLISWLIFSFGATDSNPCKICFLRDVFTYLIFVIGWFGLRRDLCEIFLTQCPFISLYFNNQFKFGPRPSTTVPTNDTILDVPTSIGLKKFESIHMNKLLANSQTNEKNSRLDQSLMSLSEPD